MPKVHALLVGIDTYRLSYLNLRGCVNDIELAERLLRDRIAPADLAVEKRCDEQATRAAIIEAFRNHLGGLGAGDIALFWYSGHGSTGPLPEEIWYAESAGMCQTIVCHDSRAGVPDLYDKELALLAHEVVDGGATLVTIMDACHSRSAMRVGLPRDLTPRSAPELEAPPELRDLLPELLSRATDPSGPVPGAQLPRHVAFSACDEWGLANEQPFPDGWHGVFTEALSHALAGLGREATYREVFSHARCRVEGRLPRQTPQLEALGDIADQEVFGGALRPRTTQVTMRYLRGRWELDAGSVHGVVGDSRFGVHRSAPLREVHVADVHTRRSVVDPIGWAPDEDQQYDMVLTDVPLPPVAVTVQGDPEVALRLTESVRTAGPGGGPSPHIRVVPAADESASRLGIRVRQSLDSRMIQVTSLDDKPLASPVPVDHRGIQQTVRDLDHIARWLQVRNLESASPALEEAIKIDLIPALPGRSRPPRDGTPPPVRDLDFAYTWTGTTWEPPSAFVRLRNTTDRKLFCVLLDLTDRYRMHADLFPGEYVAGQWTAEAGNGTAVTLSLPPDRPVEPGASGTDWLVLLVAEEPFSSAPFALPRLRDTPPSSTRGMRPGVTGVLDRLGLLAVQRDVQLAPSVALDWAVKTVEVTTRVPYDTDDPGGAPRTRSGHGRGALSHGDDCSH
ncbi:caspase family protein [Streptomyces lincolnensis]|uniref:caspase family protein n=1 Tax=Streptomyces lincolnensis TaxID=1915 RepID=UPI001E491381|nr:caspase family protein [Streptomyces lincolnensis]MCD7442258.1 caspase family protein [Streptomyces lincolnensis]